MLGHAANALPKDKDHLVRAIDFHVSNQLDRQCERRALWHILHAYLQGYRTFTIQNFREGRMKIGRLDPKGNLELPVQLLLQKMDLMRARLRSQRVGPVVARTGQGLDLVRKRAAAQALLNAVVPSDRLESTADLIDHNMLMFGGAGLQTTLNEDADGTLNADFEVVHPQELFPFPDLHLDRGKLTGVVRRRFIEVEELRSMLKGLGVSTRAFNAARERMRLWRIPYGEQIVHNETARYPTAHAAGGAPTAESNVEVAEVQEVFLGRPTLDRYIVKVGGWIAVDETPAVPTMTPLIYETLIDDGTFWGQGLADLSFGLVRRFERLLARMIQNVEDADRFGFLALPSGQFDPKTMVKDTGHGLRILLYEPDPMQQGSGARPTAISPANSGTLPGQVASGLKGLVDELLPIPPIATGQAPGRVDGGPALGMLNQNSMLPLVNAHAAKTRLFSHAYRYLAQEAAVRLSSKKARLPLTKITEDLAGVVIEEDGTVSLERNPLPDTNGLEFRTVDTEPRDRESRKAEALQLVGMGIQSPQEFRFWGLLEGVDLPIGNPTERAALEKERVAIVLLFNDGVEPGEVPDNPATMVPTIQLDLLTSFMARPEFMAASPQVREAFMARQRLLQEIKGTTLPDALGNPDDIAVELSGRTNLNARV